MSIPKPQDCIWFGFVGYPEILYMRRRVVPDTRPGHFVGYALAAHVVVGEYEGLCCHNPDTDEANSVDATLDYAKKVVEYQRRKQAGES